MGKMRNMLTGVLVGLSVVWSNPVKAQEMGTSEALKETLASKGEKSNKTQEQMIDFPQAMQAWEKQQEDIVEKSSILNEQGVEEYFAQHGTVPYLKNGSTINGDSVDITSRHMQYFCYLSNNDKVYFNPCGLIIDEIHWSWKMVDGKVEIYGHCVIDVKNPKTGGFGDITINNGANFVKENTEGKEIAHTDTLYFSNEVWNIPEEIKEQLTKGKWFYTGKIGLPKHHDPEYMAGCVERKSGNSIGYNPNEWGDVEYNEMEFDKFRTLNTLIEELGCVPYKEEVMKITQDNKTYSYKIQYYSLKTVWADWSTAHASIFWWNVPSHNCNIKKVINDKEEVSYWTVKENYRANEVEVPKYYDNVGKEVAKDSLELGRTYQLKVQAKPDYKITSVIVNGEEYTPTEEGAFTINFEVKENNKIEIKSSSTSGIEWTEVKEPGISSENGTLTIDTQDMPLQSVQIYNLKGQLIAQKSKPEWVENFQLSQGLYFVEWRTVKGELKTVKVMVK
mgnify:CR=1 FL=1